MTARILGSVLCALALGPAEARASLLVHEPFAYEPGTVLDGTPATGQNLSGLYTASGTAPQQKLTVTAPGLGYGSLSGAPAASGGRLSDTLGVAAGDARVSLAAPVTVGPGESLYWSALFTLDDRVNGNHLANITLRDAASGDFLFFGEPTVGIGGLRVAASTAATGGLVADGSDDAFVDGHTLLLIGRYLNGAAPGGDSLQLVAYDTADAIALPPSFDPADPDAAVAFALDDLDLDLAQITEILFTIRGLDNNFVDELRIGTRYTAVVPEPEGVRLVALGLAALVALRRGPRSGSV